ncbi:MAG: FeoA family protein [Candidatus Heimdallarchaeaceae archaeon]
MTSLDTISPNNEVKVVRILAGIRARQFLADLGIIEGENVRVIKNNFGPLIVEVKGTRIALGRGLATKIEVSDGLTS